MTTTELLEQGRSGFERHIWSEAHGALSAADKAAALAPADLERLATAAYMTGHDEAAASAWERAHERLVDEGELAWAARAAFWLAFVLLTRGQMARGGGWLGRARRLLDQHGTDCVEEGYLLIPAALGIMEGGDAESARALFGEANAVGERFADRDLVTLSLLGQGQALIRTGRAPEGLALLDEAMVSVIAEEVSPIVAGTVYCAVILACQEVYDVRRAQEWTGALAGWCDSQPDMVPFRGQCLVHRSELMQLHGEWSEAMQEARRACDRLSDPPGQPALGMARYQCGELCRLRGEFAEAERAFREASHCGREPQPGLARLRLAQGQIEGAEAAIRRLVGEARTHAARTDMLAAYVEIMLAAGDVAAARSGTDELAAIAAEVGATLIEARAAVGAGAVLLREGDARLAIDALQRACELWRELDSPYELARTRVLLGQACRELGDDDAWALELDAARRVFQRLGAGPDLAEINSLLGARPGAAAGLSPREVEVLALVSTGKTNRQIAADLIVSEHTVRRHLQNIFVKLGVSSRAAATAYAIEHGIA